jgi:hypothetical protein
MQPFDAHTPLQMCHPAMDDLEDPVGGMLY